MDSKIKLREGEVLDILVKRLNKEKSEIAGALNITPQHLSNVFKSEFLTQNIKQRAAVLFGVPESFFGGWYLPNLSDDDLADMVEESRFEYRKGRGGVNDLTAGEVFKYLEEKDRWFEGERVRHFEERGRLLAIIENLTKQ